MNLRINNLALTVLLAFFLSACGERQPPVRLQSYGMIEDFSLTNQAGETVTAEQLKGKTWVADFIFTSCAAECPFLTRQLRTIQQLTDSERETIAFVSLSVDPQTDTPERLTGYGEKYDVDFFNWHFLTGDPAELKRLIKESFLLPVTIGSAEKAQLNKANFIHSNRFIFVDPTGMARFHVDGMQEDAPSKVLAAIREIRREG